MYNGKKIMLALNPTQEQELKKLLRISENVEITASDIKQAFGLSPDMKAGRPKGAKNKSKIAR
jgi:hypothetical protein